MSGETDKNSVQSNEHPRPLATLNKFINYQSLSNGGQYRKRGRRRLFRCPYCPQTYVRKPWLTMHTLKKHRGPICSVTFYAHGSIESSLDYIVITAVFSVLLHKFIPF
uniref:C2H2-type domain-containing protein n=1 Tax=Mesocestoides corti TaxID=53468 RepID=A0A5K3EVP5_MESCO